LLVVVGWKARATNKGCAKRFKQASSLPGCFDDEKGDMQARVQYRQDSVSERFKNWNILNTPYCHNLLEHQTVFGAIAVLLTGADRVEACL
jgi:hypothetical protein